MVSSLRCAMDRSAVGSCLLSGSRGSRHAEARSLRLSLSLLLLNLHSRHALCVQRAFSDSASFLTMPKKKGRKSQAGSSRSASISSLSYENGRPIMVKQETQDGRSQATGDPDGDDVLFNLSDSPVEDFGENANGNEWPVERVVRFEIDITGATK